MYHPSYIRFQAFIFDNKIIWKHSFKISCHPTLKKYRNLYCDQNRFKYDIIMTLQINTFSFWFLDSTYYTVSIFIHLSRFKQKYLMETLWILTYSPKIRLNSMISDHKPNSKPRDLWSMKRKSWCTWNKWSLRANVNRG